MGFIRIANGTLPFKFVRLSKGATYGSHIVTDIDCTMSFNNVILAYTGSFQRTAQLYFLASFPAVSEMIRVGSLLPLFDRCCCSVTRRAVSTKFHIDDSLFGFSQEEVEVCYISISYRIFLKFRKALVEFTDREIQPIARDVDELNHIPNMRVAHFNHECLSNLPIYSLCGGN